MFLVDSVQAATDWEGTNSLIKTILEKAEAQIISIRKWDERKLAYDIAKKSRGAYILCYFNAPTSKITQIERDVQALGKNNAGVDFTRRPPDQRGYGKGNAYRNNGKAGDVPAG